MLVYVQLLATSTWDLFESNFFLEQFFWLRHPVSRQQDAAGHMESVMYRDPQQALAISRRISQELSRCTTPVSTHPVQKVVGVPMSYI